MGLYESFFRSELAISLMRGSEKGAMGGSGAGSCSLRISTVWPAFGLSLKATVLFFVNWEGPKAMENLRPSVLLLSRLVGGLKLWRAAGGFLLHS